MTPEQAESIDLAARKAEYRKHCDNYTPVNQRKVILAGYQAVIDAVRRECDVEFAMRYLEKSDGVSGD